MDDFDALEEQLRARAGRVNPAEQAAAEALRPRVLAAMRAARRKPATPLWVFASGAAAAVVLLANLALSTAQARSLTVADGTRTRELAGELRGLMPELDEREALRQALLLEARASTAYAVDQRRGSSQRLGNLGRASGEVEP